MNVFVFEFTEFRPRKHVSILIATGDVTFSVLLKPEEFSRSRSKKKVIQREGKNYRWNTFSESYGYFKHCDITGNHTWSTFNLMITSQQIK